MTQGRGADVCIDLVGFEPERSFMDKVKATINFEKGRMKVLEMCSEAVRSSWTVSIWVFMALLTIISAV